MYRAFSSLMRGPPLVVTAVLLAAACRSEGDDRSATRLIRDLTQTRFTVGRLTANEQWAQCLVFDSASVVPRPACASALRPGSMEFAAYISVAQRIRRRFPSDSSAGSLLAEALVDLRSGDQDTRALERAVETLRRATSKAPTSVEAFNDLANAEIELATRTQSLDAMLGALDAADRALGLESTRKESLYNRALALERLYLNETALLAWKRYLEVETDAAWRRDAEEHELAVASALERRGVLADPQRLREHGLTLLGAWGHARASGRVSVANSLIDSVRSQRRALRMPNGDKSISDMLDDIGKCSRDGEALGGLARGYATYIDALGDFGRAEYARAERDFDVAARDLRRCSPSAERWALLYAAAAAVNDGQYASADLRLRHLLDDAPASEPALSGKVLWLKALLVAHQGEFENADDFYSAAAKRFRAAGEEANVGAVAALRTEVLGLAGNSSLEHQEAFDALQILSQYRSSNFISDHLVGVSEIARSAGLVHAALDVMGEDQTIAQSLGRPTALIQTLCASAKDLLAIGDSASAEQAVKRARATVALVPSGHAHDKAAADVDLAMGRLLRARDPRLAAKELATVADAYVRLKELYFVPRAQFEAATAALDIGDTVAGRSRLDAAIESIETQSPSFSDGESRRAYFESAESVFDAMIALRLGSGESEQALVYLERERTASWNRRGDRTVGKPAEPQVSVERIQRALPTDAAFVAFAVLPSRTVTWVVTRSRSRMLSTPISPDSLSRVVDAVRREAAISLGSRAASAKLFDLLFRPAGQDLALTKKVFVVPDRELAGVPFVALWDRDHARFAIEEFDLRTLPSARFFLTVRARAPAAHRLANVLVVGDPTATAGTRSSPELGALHGATLEAKQVATVYGRSTLLLDSAATPDSVVSKLRHTSAFHFAGHAVFDLDRPDRSYLAMAPSASSNGRLEAREIARLGLSNLQVVVLSACETLGSRSTHAGAFVGLADAFLRAGVPATVSSLWEVDDEASTPLLVEFHREVARGIEPGAALRSAQLSLLHAPSLASHAAIWAAYVFIGA